MEAANGCRRPFMPQVERLLPLCEYVHVIKRFVETRSQIQYPMVVQVSRHRPLKCCNAGLRQQQ